MLLSTCMIENLEKRLRGAEQVDIAVAWAWTGLHLGLLQQIAADKKNAGCKFTLRIVVGLDNNMTHPIALSALCELAEVRVTRKGYNRRGIFHPKIFLFKAERMSHAWIGSANLTQGGFLHNREAVWETEDTTDIESWFEELWNSVSNASASVVSEYIDKWRQPSRPDEEEPAPVGADRKHKIPNKPSLLQSKPQNWSDYLNLLRRADDYWLAWTSGRARKPISVTGDTWSWSDTVRKGNIVVRKHSWAALSVLEQHVILGLSESDGAYGLLGSMSVAGTAKSLFQGKTAGNKKILEELRKSVQNVMQQRTSDDVIKAACVALTSMRDHVGIGPGVSTRLLALARPDYCVSVNKASAKALGMLTNLPASPSSLGTVDNYEKLLRRVVSQPWHKADAPASLEEKHLWSMRAALIDCFVYEP